MLSESASSLYGPRMRETEAQVTLVAVLTACPLTNRCFFRHQVTLVAVLTACPLTNCCFFRHQVTLHDPRLLDPASRLRDLATSRRTIMPHTLLHEGTFGRVYRGEYTDEETGTKADVLIKTVSGERDHFYSMYQNLVHMR